MKKLMALLFVLAVLPALLFSEVAEAVEASPVTLNWISARRAYQQAGLTGKFYEIQDFDVDVWIPTLLTPQEEVPEGWLNVFANEDNTVSVKVRIVRFDGELSLTTLDETITKMGSESEGAYWINGFNTLIFQTKEQDSLTVAIPFDDNIILEFVFNPISNQDVYSLASIIMSTIQRHGLHAMDVALMIDADLNSTWGPEKEVRCSEDGTAITVFLWENGITSQTFSGINNWEEVKQDKINKYNNYAEVMNEFGMTGKISLSLKYISPDEDLSFLTIENGEIVYDASAN